MHEIYIQIPSYRDSELGPTIEDLLAKANNPLGLRICIFWQYGPGETLPRHFFEQKNIEIIKVDYRKSKGCNWARNLMQKKWRGEKYTLFLDSHHRFAQGWDSTLVTMYESLRSSGVTKPLITAYLPPYHSKTDPGGRDDYISKIYFLERINGLILRVESKRLPLWQCLSEPVKADYVSLHFLFTAGTFNKEVPFDPDVYFMGDEVLTSLRAYTHGYDLFHPHLILGWHEYERVARVPHWNDHQDWQDIDAISKRRLKEYFTGQIRSINGIGKERSIAAYESLLGKPLFLDG